MYFYGKSDRGRVRRDNQDRCRIVRVFENCILLVVCDGMGGAKGGEIASELASSLFTEEVTARLHALWGDDSDASLPYEAEMQGEICRVLDRAAQKANRAIFERAATEEALSGMGTTLCAVLTVGAHLFVLNVGDSRAYRVSAKGMKQITHDHTYVQFLIDCGELTPGEAALSKEKNVITRSLGTEASVAADRFAGELHGRGYLLLCTDGLYNSLPPETVSEAVLAEPEALGDVTDTDYELEDKVEYLIDLANRAGGEDNITVVLAKYEFE